MAGKSVSKEDANYPGMPFRAPMTKEEKTLITMYRNISRWERNWFFLILQSLAWGKLLPKTDKMSWEEILSNTGLPKSRKEAHHA
jgi:hypothetical protein